MTTLRPLLFQMKRMDAQKTLYEIDPSRQKTIDKIITLLPGDITLPKEKLYCIYKQAYISAERLYQDKVYTIQDYEGYLPFLEQTLKSTSTNSQEGKVPSQPDYKKWIANSIFFLALISSIILSIIYSPVIATYLIAWNLTPSIAVFALCLAAYGIFCVLNPDMVYKSYAWIHKKMLDSPNDTTKQQQLLKYLSGQSKENIACMAIAIQDFTKEKKAVAQTSIIKHIPTIKKFIGKSTKPDQKQKESSIFRLFKSCTTRSNVTAINILDQISAAAVMVGMCVVSDPGHALLLGIISALCMITYRASSTYISYIYDEHDRITFDKLPRPGTNIKNERIANLYLLAMTIMFPFVLYTFIIGSYNSMVLLLSKFGVSSLSVPILFVIGLTLLVCFIRTATQFPIITSKVYMRLRVGKKSTPSSALKPSITIEKPSKLAICSDGISPPTRRAEAPPHGLEKGEDNISPAGLHQARV